MRLATELLFKPLPRFVANPRQWLVFDEKSFDYFVEANDKNQNCYSRISWLRKDGSYGLDRVFLDLDAEADSELTESELITKLRANPSFAESFLDGVVADARKIADLLAAESIPAVGVYTGKGIHIHALYEPRKNPELELKSQTNWILDTVDPTTFDQQVYGDVKRLCRVPNCHRYDERLNKPLDLVTVPLERRELREITAAELMEWSDSPRTVEKPAESRPPLLTHPDYQVDERAAQTVSAEPIEVGDMAAIENETAKEWVQEIVRLPCLQERIVSRNPHHKVRMASAIELLNVGLEVSEIVQTFAQLGWADFDPATTRKHVRQIKSKGYSSFSCATLQSENLCLWSYDERRDECKNYGFDGGVQEY